MSCYPIVTEGAGRWLEVSESLAPMQRYFWGSVARNLLNSALTATTVTLLITLFGDRFIGRPILALREKSRRIGAGDLSGPLRLDRDDERNDLAAEINAMCERLAAAHREVEEHHGSDLQTLEELRHADRLRTVGQLAAGLAHELGTPLNIVLAQARMLADGDTPAAEVGEGGTSSLSRRVA